MVDETEILQSIKKEVLIIVPDAKVYLFGSRARGDWNEESDWDILIITKAKPDYVLKNKIRDKLSYVWVETGAFINTVIVSQEDWLNSPEYYELYELAHTETIPL